MIVFTCGSRSGSPGREAKGYRLNTRSPSRPALAGGDVPDLRVCRFGKVSDDHGRQSHGCRDVVIQSTPEKPRCVGREGRSDARDAAGEDLRRLTPGIGPPRDSRGRASLSASQVSDTGRAGRITRAFDRPRGLRFQQWMQAQGERSPTGRTSTKRREPTGSSPTTRPRWSRSQPARRARSRADLQHRVVFGALNGATGSCDR